MKLLFLAFVSVVRATDFGLPVEPQGVENVAKTLNNDDADLIRGLEESANDLLEAEDANLNENFQNAVPLVEPLQGFEIPEDVMEEIDESLDDNVKLDIPVEKSAFEQLQVVNLNENDIPQKFGAAFSNIAPSELDSLHIEYDEMARELLDEEGVDAAKLPRIQWSDPNLR